MPLSLWLIDDDEEVAPEALNLHKSSSNSGMRGCGLVGKLIERA